VSTGTLLGETRRLVAQARAVYARDAGALEALARAATSLEEPLRVAIAGKVKAGKSTLLNALVGEQLAPTDAGECTRIVTWYRDGTTYAVVAHLRDGSTRPLRFTRDRGALEVDLGGLPSDEVERLDVTWPSATLRRVTLIDTPGIGSASDATSDRTHRFLTAEDDPAPADAVLYLMRHLHSQDLAFLDAFQDAGTARATPVNALAVLSRADEIGVGRLDAMASARRAASRYRTDAKLRALVQTVVPMAGLLAETATTLTEDEFRALRELGTLAPAALERLLVSTDRFLAGEGPALTEGERAHLLARLGLFGVRLGATLLRRDDTATAGTLARELEQRSGLVELRALLGTLFTERADALRARSALLVVEDVLGRNTAPGDDELATDLERVLAGAHALDELRTLAAVRSGTVRGRPDEMAELDRLLGGEGTAPTDRLGLAPDADRDAQRAAVHAAIGRWRRRAENPLTAHELAQAAATAIRSCEGLAHELDGPR
jgi:hypothetical protein